MAKQALIFLFFNPHFFLLAQHRLCIFVFSPPGSTSTSSIRIRNWIRTNARQDTWMPEQCKVYNVDPCWLWTIKLRTILARRKTRTRTLAPRNKENRHQTFWLLLLFYSILMLRRSRSTGNEYGKQIRLLVFHILCHLVKYSDRIGDLLDPDPHKICQNKCFFLF